MIYATKAWFKVRWQIYATNKGGAEIYATFESAGIYIYYR